MPNLPASDQYALGIVVYEWLCGSYPFANIRIEHRQTLPPLREKAPSIPQALEDVVMKALAKDPKDRFESVQVFADALEQASRLALLGQQFGSYRLISCLGGGKIG